MELGPILRSLIRGKGRFWLIAVEIALTLAVVVNCLNTILDFRAKMLRPTGIDEPHVLEALTQPFAREFEDLAFCRSILDEDLRALAALPGVRAVAAMHAMPLSGGGSATARIPTDGEGPNAGAGVGYFLVEGDVVGALGVELVSGRNLEEADFLAARAPATEGETAPRNVLLTEAAAQRLFAGGPALGRTIRSRDGSRVDRVVGTIHHMHGSWPNSSVAEALLIAPSDLASPREVRYVVRAEPGMTEQVASSLEAELLRLHDGRIVGVRTLVEIKSEFYGTFRALTQLFGGVSVLLVAVTALGIVGLTSFSVTQRTRQIGTRRALGATRWAILRYFLVENWVITTAGLALGIAATYGLNYALAQMAEMPRIGWPLVGTGVVFLWLVGLLAAAVPALRGTAVPPVVATRSV